MKGHRREGSGVPISCNLPARTCMWGTQASRQTKRWYWALAIEHALVKKCSDGPGAATGGSSVSESPAPSSPALEWMPAEEEEETGILVC